MSISRIKDITDDVLKRYQQGLLNEEDQHFVVHSLAKEQRLRHRLDILRAVDKLHSPTTEFEKKPASNDAIFRLPKALAASVLAGVIAVAGVVSYQQDSAVNDVAEVAIVVELEPGVAFDSLQIESTIATASEPMPIIFWQALLLEFQGQHAQLAESVDFKQWMIFVRLLVVAERYDTMGVETECQPLQGSSLFTLWLGLKAKYALDLSLIDIKESDSHCLLRERLTQLAHAIVNDE